MEQNSRFDFENWLPSFSRLPSAARLTCLYRLSLLCEPSELYLLKKFIASKLKYDIISLLPTEVTHHLFTYLDVKDLLACCQVCTAWNRLVSMDDHLWKKLCIRYGFSTSRRGFSNHGAVSVSKTTCHTIIESSSNLEHDSALGDTNSVSFDKFDKEQEKCEACQCVRNFNKMDISVHAQAVDTISETVYEENLRGEACSGQRPEGSDKSWCGGTTRNGQCNQFCCGSMASGNQCDQFCCGPAAAANSDPDSLSSQHLYPVVKRQRTESYKQLFLRTNAYFENVFNLTGVERMVLFGHTEKVTALYYHDGKLATGSEDRTVRLWDCSSGVCIQCFTAHSVSALKFYDSLLMTASYDTTAALWSLDTGIQIQVFSGHTSSVFSIDFSETLDRAVTGAIESVVKIWRLKSGQPIHTLVCPGTSMWITSIRINHWLSSGNPSGDASKGKLYGAPLNHETKRGCEYYEVVVGNLSTGGYWTIEKTGDKVVRYCELYSMQQPMRCLGLEMSDGGTVRLATSVVCENANRVVSCCDEDKHLHPKAFSTDVMLATHRQLLTEQTFSINPVIHTQPGPSPSIRADSRDSEFSFDSALEFDTLLGSGSAFSAYICHCNTDIVIGPPVLSIVQRGIARSGALARTPLKMITLPPQFRSCRRAKTVTLGETAWLNGLNVDSVANSMMYAVACTDNTVCVFKFGSP